MRNALKILVTGCAILALWLPVDTGALLAGSAGGNPVVKKPSFGIGLDIRFDADWIFFTGSLWLTDGDADVNGAHRDPVRKTEVELGGVPNMLHRARQGIALVRAVRTTTMCLVRKWIED